MNNYLKVDPKRAVLKNINYTAIKNEEILNQLFAMANGKINIKNSYNTGAAIGINKSLKENEFLFKINVHFSELANYLQEDVEISNLDFVYHFFVEITDETKIELIKELAKKDKEHLTDSEKEYIREIINYLNKAVYPGMKRVIELVYMQSGNIKKLPN